MPQAPEYYSFVNIFRHAQQNRDFTWLCRGQGSSILTKRVQDYLAADFIQDNMKYGIYNNKNVSPEIYAQI
jgi:hypothetical protein